MADQRKKMNVVQLTFIVAVNMMGSGIIMLPTNMAKVGAISLLSWVVTALGSMAMAYGFAQAGIYNQRPGGLAAYAEDAYGKDGYFQTFFLYFVSLAIANVAVAVSALGYLAGFFPALTATPAATCAGVIGLLWLTSIANFGGPKRHRAHRLGHGVGRDPAGRLHGDLRLVLVQGLDLRRGMESERPQHRAGHGFEHLAHALGVPRTRVRIAERVRRREPEARRADRVSVRNARCRGHLRAVDHGDPGDRTQRRSPGLDRLVRTAFAQMFNPTVGSIVMGLAVMACVGSLFGWQFTLASVAKDAADTGMFPRIFGKVTANGAPIAGMVIMGVVQTMLALMTISPDLSSQFSALVNLSVVTNVVPYILALSALTVILQSAGVVGGAYTRTIAISVVGIAYSVYALYASGVQAVMGGMLVMGLGWLIWLFVAPRFVATRRATAQAAAVRASRVKGKGDRTWRRPHHLLLARRRLRARSRPPAR